MVDNTVGEDWNDVELSLAAGAPQSFIQQLSQPYYMQRPTVGLPRGVLLSPQTHNSTLVSVNGGQQVLETMNADTGGRAFQGGAGDWEAEAVFPDALWRDEVELAAVQEVPVQCCRRRANGWRTAQFDV